MLQLKAILAGMCFAIWPLFMNRTGLSGNVSSAIYCAMVLIGVLPFALQSNGFSIPAANWTMVGFAGVFGILGLLSFNGMLSSASSQDVGILLVLVIVAQIPIIALHQIIVTGGHLSIDKIGGCIATAIAAYLLLR